MGAFLVAHPVMKQALAGAITGVSGAALIDVRLFLASHSWGEFFEHWDLKVASFRYMQGAIGGAVGGLGVGAVIG